MDRILGFDLPTLYNLGMQLLNTAILCAILAYLLYKPVKEFLRKRAERIQNQLDSARRDYDEARAAKDEYTKALKEIDKERAAILENARKQALVKEDEIISRAKHEAETIRNRALSEIALEEERVRDEIRCQIIELSSVIAGRFVSSELDEQKHAQLIDGVILELGDARWQS